MFHEDQLQQKGISPASIAKPTFMTVSNWDSNWDSDCMLIAC